MTRRYYQDQNSSKNIYECFGNADPRYANRKRTIYSQSTNQDNLTNSNNYTQYRINDSPTRKSGYSSHDTDHLSSIGNLSRINDSPTRNSGYSSHDTDHLSSISNLSRKDAYSLGDSYRSSRVTSSRKINFKGIRNICNTCFINSVLQVLLNLPQFMSDIINSLEHIDHQFGSTSFIQEICQIFYKYISNQKDYIQINKFYDILREKIPYLGDGGQHDVAEFFQLLAESCENEILPFLSATDRKSGEILLSKSQMLLYDPFMKNFGFSIITNVVCGRCGCAITEEVQTNFILHLPFVARTLEECLSQSFAKERIEMSAQSKTPDYSTYSYSYDYRYRRTMRTESNSGGYFCKECQNRSSFYLCSSLYRIPRFLIIQIARFDASLTKNSLPINVPDRINLQKYINEKYFAGPDQIRIKNQDEIDISPITALDSDDDGLYSYQKATRKRRSGQDAHDCPAVSEDEKMKHNSGYPDASYHLVSVILHEGSFSAGHYSTAIKSQRSSSEWTVISDDIVMGDARVSPALPYCFIYQID